jgi:hypothetical protein
MNMINKNNDNGKGGLQGIWQGTKRTTKPITDLSNNFDTV